MTGRVGIIGAYSTSFVASRMDVSLQELVYEGAKGTLEDAGLGRLDIDEVILCAHDLIDGRGIANMVSAGAAGAYMKSELRTPNDGIFALILGCISVLAGRADLLLVIGWAKPSEGFDDAVTATEFEPFYQRPTGLTEARALGLQATRLLQRDGQAARAAATAAVVRDRRYGSENPEAHLRAQVRPDEFASAPTVTWPLTELDLAPRSDGACGIVLASERRAAKLARQPLWVKGIGWSADGYALGARDLARSESLERAADQAYRSADLDGPDAADIVEYAARSSFQHLVVVEGLRLCDAGEGAQFLRGSGTGEQPLINPSGGLASSNPLVVGGLMSAVSVVRRLRGEAVANQRARAGVGLVHGSSGPCGQSNAVTVLSASLNENST